MNLLTAIVVCFITACATLCFIGYVSTSKKSKDNDIN